MLVNVDKFNLQMSQVPLNTTLRLHCALGHISLANTRTLKIPITDNDAHRTVHLWRLKTVRSHYRGSIQQIHPYAHYNAEIKHLVNDWSRTQQLQHNRATRKITIDKWTECAGLGYLVPEVNNTTDPNALLIQPSTTPQSRPNRS